MFEEPSPRYAPVAPAHIMQTMLQKDPRGLFGTYHLWLAHLVAESPTKWIDVQNRWYSDRRVDGLTILMDNSIVELGAAQSMEMVKAAVNVASTYRNLVIPVLPDVMGNGYETLRMTLSEWESWKRNIPHPYGFMLVAQGKSWDDFTQLVDFFLIENRSQFPEIKWIGIPRRLTPVLGSRRTAIEYVRMVAPEMNIHLLGFSDNICDDLWCAKLSNVRGIDTAVAVRYNAPLTPGTSELSIGPRHSWMEDGQLIEQNMINIRNVRKWIGQKDY